MVSEPSVFDLLRLNCSYPLDLLFSFYLCFLVYFIFAPNSFPTDQADLSVAVRLCASLMSYLFILFYFIFILCVIMFSFLISLSL